MKRPSREVIEPVKPAVTWSPIIDAPATPVRWPSDLKNQLIDVKPPVTMARSSPGSPFVAFVDGVALNVYDVRSGKRTGFIKDKPPVIGSLLSPGWHDSRHQPSCAGESECSRQRKRVRSLVDA